MIDLIPGITFSDTEKQVYGSIAGAILGALVGALAGAASTYLIGNRERTKQDELQKIQQNRSFIRKSALSLQTIELAINDVLIKCEANNEYARDIQKGLTKKEGDKLLALMQLSTPFEYPKPDAAHTQTILNDRIVTLWNNLCQEIELQNKNIVDFADYYKILFSTVHASILKSEAIDVSVVESDSKTVVKGMEQQLRANTQLRKKCINLLAYIDCFKTFLNIVDTKEFRSLSQYRSYFERLAVYEPQGQELVEAVKSEDELYDPSKMFKSESTGN